MRVLNRAADLDKKFQPLLGIEAVLITEVREPHAMHQFHDKKRTTTLRRAGVQHPGNVRMIHQCQCLLLRLEPGDDTLRIHAELDDLERHPAADWQLLFRHINHPATALANFLEQFVRPDF